MYIVVNVQCPVFLIQFSHFFTSPHNNWIVLSSWLKLFNTEYIWFIPRQKVLSAYYKRYVLIGNTPDSRTFINRAAVLIIAGWFLFNLAISLAINQGRRTCSPTDTFTILELQNPSIDKFYAVRKCQSPELEALKLWMYRLGGCGIGEKKKKNWIYSIAIKK